MLIVNLSESDATLITIGNVGAKGQFNIYIYIYIYIFYMINFIEKI